MGNLNSKSMYTDANANEMNGLCMGGDWVAFDDHNGAGSACNFSVLTPKLTLRSIAAT